MLSNAYTLVTNKRETGSNERSQAAYDPTRPLLISLSEPPPPPPTLGQNYYRCSAKEQGNMLIQDGWNAVSAFGQRVPQNFSYAEVVNRARDLGRVL